MLIDTVVSADLGDEKLAEADILSLDCSQLAVALHVGGLPYRWHHLSVRELFDLAMAGIEMVGLNEIARIKTESISLNMAIHRAARTRSADAPAQHRFREIWSSHRRHQNAVDAAWTILHAGDTPIAT